jgi:pyruvate-ferredoxin/flavodoxin oxidoreductase
MPKKFITCDGNYAAAHIAYMFSEVAAIYPITPSSTMAEYVDEWASQGRKNLFGEVVRVAEMQSEAGAAGAVHGSLQAGALTTTYTASQGLLLMIPNMYKISGELLPGVFHVSARALAAHALSIFGDHSDVMSTRHTGFAMLATGSVQEVMDLAAVAHLSAIKSRIPFVHFFDGFRTSHEIQKIESIEPADLDKLLDKKAVQAFRDNALNPEHPVTRGTAQNPDIYFQAREASNPFYEAVPDIVAKYMEEMGKITGRSYQPFDYYGDPSAENIIIAMGSVTETIKEVIDVLVAKGEKVGLVAVHLYRPLSAKYFFKAMPAGVKHIAVLDRTKEPGSEGEPLYLDVKNLFYGKPNAPVIVGGRYGLSSKDTTPAQIFSVFDNLKAKEPKNGFTIGIVDDVTFKSLPVLPEVNVVPEGTFQAKFWGLGSDGTVGANKNSIKIIGETTNKYCQAYFAYDSKKSGGVTMSHLRFGDKPIHSTYLVTTPDFVACHVQSYLDKYDLLRGLKKGGTFLLNTIWSAEETKKRLPEAMKKYMADNTINFYIINATKIAEDLGLGNRTNTIMQASFFSISKVIDYVLAENEMKKMVAKSYAKKGEEIVKMNNAAIDRGTEFTKIEIPTDWKNLSTKNAALKTDVPEFISKFVMPVSLLMGDDLPVSVFKGREDGTLEAGTAAYEKRSIAVNVPQWIPENCIQCNQCSYVCPHAVIRPFLFSEQELKGLPEGTKTLAATGAALKGLQFKIQVSTQDCTGCGNCAERCPAKTKALVMKPIASQEAEIAHWNWISKNVTYKDTLMPKDANVKNSQFSQPLFEFSGACGGCGETPYIKLITQLFGDRMMIGNATGCSSIYGGSSPSSPYCKNSVGKGPAWANSLFEDNAEYGYGMAVGVRTMRDQITNLMNAAMAEVKQETKDAFGEWIAGKNDAAKSKTASEKVLAALKNESGDRITEILKLKQYLVKKSVWVFGGDGWAYDIGFGGLDHVIASGEDVNILVVDTEVYSNTGGQASKSTPVAAVAKFAAAGKRIRKKDLGMIAMSYGYVYVAQVNMGANQSQYLKTLREAETYPGPSLIIAYAPCINQGFRNMGNSQLQAQMAAECGYWHLYRYNPLLENEGKNPFQLDSKEPNWANFQQFLQTEVRYSSLKKVLPTQADELFKAAEVNAKWRYNSYVRMSQMNYAK